MRALGISSRWVLALLVLAGPALGHEKRTDRCGCHHQYGLRHCHPDKKSKKCEAPAKGQTEVKPREKKQEPVKT
jgi:hypothetical protein